MTLTLTDTTPVSVRMTETMLELGWPDGTQSRYPYIWLRDNCATAFHPKTQERTLDLLSVPDSPHPVRADIEGAAVTLSWRDGAPDSRFELAWLRAMPMGERRPDHPVPKLMLWRASDGAEDVVARYAAPDIERDDTTLIDWLSDTARCGISIVTDVGTASWDGSRIAQRVAFLRETNFGTRFEVMNKPDPNNIAYTAEALTLHTDLPNQALPPGFQFLHCLANDATGGASIFADGYALAEDLRREDPEAFALLTEVSIPFVFHDDNTRIMARRPVIRLGHDGAVEEVCWSVHLAHTFDMPPEQMVPYYRAYRAFMAKTRDPAYQITLKLSAGEMVAFDNRRILHGRTAFDPNTGFRHLQGFYVDRGDIYSRLRVGLARR